MNETPHRYTAELAGQIEVAWQDRWQEEGTFHAPNPAGPWAEPEKVGGREKFVLDMFRTPAVQACTSATRWATSPPTSTRSTG